MPINEDNYYPWSFGTGDTVTTEGTTDGTHIVEFNDNKDFKKGDIVKFKNNNWLFEVIEVDGNNLKVWVLEEDGAEVEKYQSYVRLDSVELVVRKTKLKADKNGYV